MTDAQETLLPNLFDLCQDAVEAADTLAGSVRFAVGELIVRDGRVDRSLRTL